MSDPFILTAALPDDLFAYADGLRRAHFPPERNHLNAHVTLFHALAPSLGEELRTALAQMTRAEPPPAARLTGLMNLGGGTALAIESADMMAVRAAIADRFHGALTSQDQHRPRLHVTVQNKVKSAEAKALQAQLHGTLPLRGFRFPALELHIYRGGPWEFVKRFAFRG